MKRNLSALAGAVLLLASGASNALTFNFTFLSGTSAAATQAFVDAGNRWSSIYSDNITLNMTVGTASLGAGILASTGSTYAPTISYATYLAALAADRTSASDYSAVAGLPTGSSFKVLINNTSDNPNGAGSATPWLDTTGANTNIIRLKAANAKALGLPSGSAMTGNCTSACDASITFSNTFAFDFNPTDGVTAGQYDFVGIATHEIGHALGFVSGVDILDINGTSFPSDAFSYVNSLDLYRFSTASAALGAIDFTANTTAKYFSLDGGTTSIAGFSTGRTYGDGQQASHWKDNLGIGIMDPTAGTGELLAISANDTLALDVIGYNLITAVPEPGTYALFGLGLLGLAWRRRMGAGPR